MRRTTQTPVQTGRPTAAPQHTASPLDMAVEQTEKQRSLISTAAERMGTSPDKLIPLLRNVWKTSKGQEPLSDQELTAGIALIAKYDLDPFTRELYVSRASDGRLFTIVGIDGWVKILDRTDHYDGFEQVHGEDEIGEFVETTIYSKKRSHPTTYRAHMATWRALGGFMWGKIGHHMLTLLSLRHAARLFSPVGGAVVTEEEFEAAAGNRMAGGKQRQAGTLDELLASASGAKQEKNGDAEPKTEYPESQESTEDAKAAAYQHAWARFDAAREKTGPSRAIELKEELGWPGIVFAKLSAEQLDQLSDRLEAWLTEREIAEADAQFAKGAAK